MSLSGRSPLDTLDTATAEIVAGSTVDTQDRTCIQRVHQSTSTLDSWRKSIPRLGRCSRQSRERHRESWPKDDGIGGSREPDDVDDRGYHGHYRICHADRDDSGVKRRRREVCMHKENSIGIIYTKKKNIEKRKNISVV